MFKVSFKNIEELKEFLDNSDYDEVKFCVNPDYIEAIMGVSDEGKIIYNYDAMVRHLVAIYEKEADCEDPYTDAVEWIDYNCNIPYWEIVYCEEIEEDGIETIIPELSDKFNDYKNTIIGQNTYGELLINSEYVTDQNIEDIENILNGYYVDYKIV